MEKSQVVNQAYRSVKWAALASVLPRFITPLATMIVAGLLTPSDFGIVAAAMLVVTMAQIVVGLGMGPAVIQRQSALEHASSIAFASNLVIALVLYGMLWWLSPAIANIYRMPPLVCVLRVAGLALFLSALVSIPTALLQRRLDFRKLLWIGAVPQILTAIVSVFLAMVGGGYWSLVISQLAGVALNAVLVWRASEWRPRRGFDGALARSLLMFGLWIMFSSFQSWLFLYGDNAIAGYFLGAQGLGVYALGFSIANLLPGMIVAPLAAVAYPAFCALQDEGPHAVGVRLLRIQTAAAMAVVPLSFGLSAIAVPLVSLLYGPKWPGLGMVIQWLVIMPGISNVWSLNADAYRAIGRPDIWAKSAGISLAILLPLLWVTGSFGLTALVCARFGGAFVLPLSNAILQALMFGCSLREQARSLMAPFVAAGLMYLGVMLLSMWLAPFEGVYGWIKLAAIVILGMIVYAMAIRSLGRELYVQFIGSVRRALLPS